MRMRRLLPPAATVVLLGCLWYAGTAGRAFGGAMPPQAAASQPAAQVALPNRQGSLKFGVLGDFGNGTKAQYELGTQMGKLHERFPFELVITVGDNLYGARSRRTSATKFEEPYKALLDAGVKFYASLGNHDQRELQRAYKLFNMDGKLYYSFKAPKQDVRFFALDSTYMDPVQAAWVRRSWPSSREAWKIPYFHHPLYSSGGTARLDADNLRTVLRADLRESTASASCFAGHDHFYERTKPQKGIVHFVDRLGRAAAEGQHRPADRPHRAGLRYRPGVPRGRDRRRRALLQRHLADGSDSRLRRHPAAETGVASFSRSLARFGRSRPHSSQSASNTACTFLAIRESVTIMPTSRRPSSSSLRRLWLPMNAAVPSRMMARTCSRMSASLRHSTPGHALLDLADDPDLDAGARCGPG